MAVLTRGTIGRLAKTASASLNTHRCRLARRGADGGRLEPPRGQYRHIAESGGRGWGDGPRAGGGHPGGDLGEGDEAAFVLVEAAKVGLEHGEGVHQLQPKLAVGAHTDGRGGPPGLRRVLAAEGGAWGAAGDGVDEQHEALEGEAVSGLRAPPHAAHRRRRRSSSSSRRGAAVVYC